MNLYFEVYKSQYDKDNKNYYWRLCRNDYYGKKQTIATGNQGYFSANEAKKDIDLVIQTNSLTRITYL